MGIQSGSADLSVPTRRLDEIFAEADRAVGTGSGGEGGEAGSLEDHKAAAARLARATRVDVDTRMRAVNFANLVVDEVLSSPTAVDMYKAWAEFVKKHVCFSAGAEPRSPREDTQSSHGFSGVQ